ncbi:hypothetical protein OAG1_32380 [Agarivorans sp. OAG1]|uniref:Cytoplasmic protein n=1 Tax=Agarivorans albus MKT 106 TaxID=1331007 RepID=R9PH61_AGAAL|nr:MULTISPECIES: DUF3820 family protein [Agarivorans]MPW27992.1 hypothetical protein [Agarivorans sp. B2Z047]UQN44177.1 DUF3820 family protein [Agarivorans sp. B2Z047]BEU04438.1 hypothetical protein OAG1_32380 [Agarivorans sp. OAG1]GAD00593.1 hypothetical protein AALB_0673 [Agarivorans albus MKT 106]
MNEQFLSANEPFDKTLLLKVARHKMPFGKYAGREIIRLPEEYLLWFANNDGFPNGELGQLMALALEIQIAGLEKIIWPLIDTKHQ